MNDIKAFVENYWQEAIATFIVGWLLLKAQFKGDQESKMKDRIHQLEMQHVEMSTSLLNLKTEVGEVKSTQKEIQYDIKELLRRSEIKPKKKWFER